MTEKAADEVGIRELKAQLSEFIGRVMFGGEAIPITKNGKRVAVLVSADYFDRAEAALAREAAE